MTPPATFAAVRRIVVYCPINAETLAAVARGDVSALARDGAAGRILSYIEGCPDLGAFGSYRGVCEVSIGIEAFTPATGATPTSGRVGERSHSPTAAITTYAHESVADERLDTLLADLTALHPWEIPVIEVAMVTLRKPMARG